MTAGPVFGQFIRRRREKLGISHEAFADKVGLHRTYQSAIELGKVQVSIGIAQKLTHGFGSPLSKIWQEVEKARG